MPTARYFLLSSSADRRSCVDASLLSGADPAALASALSRYRCLESTLEGELIALVAALCGETSALPLGKRTQQVLARIGFSHGQLTSYGDLARKFDQSPSAVRDVVRGCLTRMAQASLCRLLPPMPHVEALKLLLSVDEKGRWLSSKARLPDAVGSSGRLPKDLVILLAWDVLRWKLPAPYRPYFLTHPALVPVGQPTRGALAATRCAGSDRAGASADDAGVLLAQVRMGITYARASPFADRTVSGPVWPP